MWLLSHYNSRAVVIETMWPAEPKTSALWPFVEKKCLPLPNHHRLPPLLATLQPEAIAVLLLCLVAFLIFPYRPLR